MVLHSVLPLANLYVLKLLVDAVTGAGATNGTAFSIPVLLCIYCGIFLTNRIVGVLSGVNNDVMTQRLVDYLSDMMQRQSARLDMAYFDNPSYHDTYHRAQQEASYRPLQVLNGFMGLFESLITISGIAVMLATASWWIILVMVVAVLPSFVIRLLKSRKIYAFRRNSTQDYRKTGYYSALLGAREYAQEMRTFGLAPYFRERYVGLRKRLVERLLKISRRLATYDAMSAVVETVALLVIIYFLIRSTAEGSITVGSFVMLFEAFRRGQSQLSSLVGSISSLYDNRLFLGNMFEFLELRPNIVSPKEPVPFPKEVSEVEFRDITFRYPNMQHDVLSHFTLRARAGEVTRVEGENGYGKTTLLKLLLRLYDPDEGAVLVNGTDVRQFDVKELRKGVGAIFQDFVRYYCTVGENIAFGDVGEMAASQESGVGVNDRVREAARRAGADGFIERLPKGYETLLGRLFDHGEELSMGQWQRIALARQLYGDAPVLLFDEPTAWLDVAARKRLEETLEELVKENKVVILIKHI